MRAPVAFCFHCITLILTLMLTPHIMLGKNSASPTFRAKHTSQARCGRLRHPTDELPLTRHLLTSMFNLSGVTIRD
jgi:hypothetical protein